MNADPATAAPMMDAQAAEPAPRNPARAPLLGLVRKLIAHGREIVASLRARNTPSPPPEIARDFGGINLALIIARITRGLMIAAVLEARLLRSPLRRAEPKERAAPRQPSASRGPRKPAIDEEAELHGALPSAREIAQRLRKRPVGAVLVEICRDLGINTMHPLWREIHKAVIFNGGNFVSMLNVLQRRAATTLTLPVPPESQARYEAALAAYAHPS